MSSEANKKRGSSESERFLIFSDASVDSKLQTGFGAYLAITETELDIIDAMEDASRKTEALHSKLQLKKFTAASPTQLEIETALWALHEVRPADHITLYTDSQSIIDLPRRRQKLEQSGFIGGATGKALKNADLYRAFYRAQDRLGFKLAKLKGHSKHADKMQLDLVFSCVDKATRKALREYRKSLGI